MNTELQTTEKNSTTSASYAEQAMLPFEMGEIGQGEEQQAKRGWNVYVNQSEIGPVSDVQLVQNKMGIEVNYGQRPEGYDGFVIRELGGGGAVTIPYTEDESGQIFVGLVHENRPALGGSVYNVPRGFLDRGENHEEAAIRELSEETGYKALGSRIVRLASGLNPNSTYFDTSKSEDEGVSIFALPIETSDLDLVTDDDGHVSYVFPAHIREQAEGDKPAERILGSKFVPIQEAINSRDMFTSAAAGHLLVRLLQEGYLIQQGSGSADKTRPNA